jgi:glucose-6-phosphate 1-dehydrogenase
VTAAVATGATGAAGAAGASVASDALVFFGATGDLARKKIFPALQAMVRRDQLRIPIIGVASDGWTQERLRERARESLQEQGLFDEQAFAALAPLLQYIDGDYRDPATYVRLRQALGAAARPLHYLAIPPHLFATVIRGLSTAGCSANARVVVEKPFGTDLASAKELNKTLQASFAERDIFRIDHYLGKETVQNMIYLRFGNSILRADLEPSLHRPRADHRGRVPLPAQSGGGDLGGGAGQGTGGAHARDNRGADRPPPRQR